MINHDGLTDAYTQYHMGTCAEEIVRRVGIKRKDQDSYSEQSYQRAIDGWDKGVFDDEVDSISIEIGSTDKMGRQTGKGTTITMKKDEEFLNKPAKIPELRPLFALDPEFGTVTVGNTSKLSDGACALLLASEKAVLEHSLNPIAQILAHSDAAMESIDFTQAVVLAIEKLFKKTGIDQHQIAQWVSTSHLSMF